MFNPTIVPGVDTNKPSALVSLTSHRSEHNAYLRLHSLKATHQTVLGSFMGQRSNKIDKALALNSVQKKTNVWPVVGPLSGVLARAPPWKGLQWYIPKAVWSLWSCCWGGFLSYRSELNSSLGDMERRMPVRYFRNITSSGGNTTVVLLLLVTSGKRRGHGHVTLLCATVCKISFRENTS